MSLIWSVFLLIIHAHEKMRTEATKVVTTLMSSQKSITKKDPIFRGDFKEVEDTLSFPDFADGNCSDVDAVMSVNLGYYQSWAKWRDQSCYPVRPADIDVKGNGYTHLAYTFASINATFHLEPWGGNYDGEVPLYEEFNALKKTYPGLRTLIAVGGWTFSDPGETEYRFSDTALKAQRRKIFADSCVDFCLRYNFDGIDLDWEYPGDVDHGGRVEDYETFVLLVQEVRDAFDAAGKDWILTIASPVSRVRLSEGFNLPVLAQSIDFFHIMTYNIFSHYQVSREIGANTGMKAIFGIISYYINQGVSSDKIVMGLAAFGRTYTLEDPSCDTKGCYFSGPGEGGCAGSDGFMPYFTIEEYIQSGNYKINRFNPTTLTMELVVNKNLFISYDNPDTYAIKGEFASLTCFRGVMWWSVDMIHDPIPIGTLLSADEISSLSPSVFPLDSFSHFPTTLSIIPSQYETESPVILMTENPVSSPSLVLPNVTPNGAPSSPEYLSANPMMPVNRESEKPVTSETTAPSLFEPPTTTGTDIKMPLLFTEDSMSTVSFPPSLSRHSLS
jgi:chitinase